LLTPAADDDLGRRALPYRVQEYGRGSLLRGGGRLMDRFTQNDPERQANIAFILIFLGIIAVGALTIWLFYGASF
jgi:hypothetical protein